MSHYFTDNRHLSENRKDLSFRFSGYSFVFTSDNGVFSKSDIDEGTICLMDTVFKHGMSDSLLDLGCGYGVVGIVMKQCFPETRVVGCDVNPRAVELAQLNAKTNDVDVHFIVSDRFSNITEQFSTIMVNPPIRAGKDVIYSMFSESYEHLTNEGKLWVVIRKSHGAPSAKKKLFELFGNCEIVARHQGYYVLVSTKH